MRFKHGHSGEFIVNHTFKQGGVFGGFSHLGNQGSPSPSGRKAGAALAPLRSSQVGWNALVSFVLQRYQKIQRCKKAV